MRTRTVIIIMTYIIDQMCRLAYQKGREKGVGKNEGRKTRKGGRQENEEGRKGGRKKRRKEEKEEGERKSK